MEVEIRIWEPGLLRVLTSGGTITIVAPGKADVCTTLQQFWLVAETGEVLPYPPATQT